jgi:NAD(P)H-hydrate epimerase
VSRAALDTIRDRARWADAVVVGPGLSRNEETDRVVLQILSELTLPVVVDADALTAVAAEPDVVRKRRGETILTPHAGELGRLTGKTSSEIELDRLGAARAAARRYHSIVVLKGAPTVTGLENGTAYVNPTGNPGMASIGTGDVLTGVIASLRAQGMEAPSAAFSGVFLHGRSGDLAAARLGERSLLASDLLDHLSSAIRSVES